MTSWKIAAPLVALAALACRQGGAREALPALPAARCCVEVEGTWVIAKGACALAFPAAAVTPLAYAVHQRKTVAPLSGVSRRRALRMLDDIGHDVTQGSAAEAVARVAAEARVDELPDSLPARHRAVADVAEQGTIDDEQFFGARIERKDDVDTVNACMIREGADAAAVDEARAAVMGVVTSAARFEQTVLGPGPPLEEVRAVEDRDHRAMCCTALHGRWEKEACSGADTARVTTCTAGLASPPPPPPVKAHMARVALSVPWRRPTRALIVEDGRAVDAALSTSPGPYDARLFAASPPPSVAAGRTTARRVADEIWDRTYVKCLFPDEVAGRVVVDDEPARARCKAEAARLLDLEMKARAEANRVRDGLFHCCTTEVGILRAPFGCDPKLHEIYDACLDALHVP